MPQVMTGIVAGSAALLALWTLWQLRSPARRVQAAITLLLLAIYIAVMHSAFDFPSLASDIAKGPAGTEPDARPLVLALFLCMVLGMGAEYVYQFLDSRSAKFDWRTFAKPFLVSPLVFVPLAASLQNSNVNLSHFDIPVLMLFLVAFENGFLWRGYFTRKLAQSSEPSEVTAKAKQAGA